MYLLLFIYLFVTFNTLALGRMVLIGLRVELHAGVGFRVRLWKCVWWLRV